MEIKDTQLLGMVQNSSWAMYLPKLEEISLFLEQKINGINLDFTKLESMRSGHTADQTYQVSDSVAIIPIYGSLLKRANLMSSMSGGSSMQIIERDIANALADDKVEAILLDVDSPGGTVDGTKQLADFIFNSRGTKPIVAYGNGMMCSAAYWIASASDYIVAFDTTLTGSIGVATVHYDRSNSDEKSGVKRTIITAGKYKQIANDANPLSEDAKAIIQSELNDIHVMFKEDVARNLGVDVKTIASSAQGQVFLGQKAFEAGLVHEIGDFNKALEKAKTLTKGKTMNFAEYRSKFPAEAQAGIDSILAEERGKITKQVSEQLGTQVSADVEKLRSDVATLTESLNTVSEENKKSKLMLAAVEENNRQVKADAILTKTLVASTLSTKAQDKVREIFKGSGNKISLDAYLTESGSLDEAKFGASVAKEIADFEALSNGSDNGTRLPQGEGSSLEAGASAQEDIAFGQSLVTDRLGKQDR